MPPKFRRDGAGQMPERQALLDDCSDDEDFFLRGPSAQPSRLNQDPKLGKLKTQVDEVIDVMQNNIGKVMERGDKLDDLQDKSESLTNSADQFRMRARNLRSQMWWKECRMRILLAVIVTVVLLIIIVPIIIHYKQ